VITDLDMWRSANTLVEHHGDEATIVAAMRADALLGRGDMEGNRLWLRILAKVKELKRDKRSDGEGVN
jgi:hypothetical protein